ncbi:MAG TPA: TIR domain-containing protein [Mucilaginibacter sp.]|nr:TIR domain-containing protein [Mucilaginibacter sp.]
MEKLRKIFLSRKEVTPDELKELVTKLEEHGCEVKISDLEEELSQMLENEEEIPFEEIEWCDIIFVLIGNSTDENDCVNKEIEEGSNQEKPIVGIYMGGNAECVPKSLEDYGSGLITNDINKITRILTGGKAQWEDEKGVSRKPKNTIDKSEC